MGDAIETDGDLLRRASSLMRTRALAAGHGCGYLHEHNAGWVEVELPPEHNARPIYEIRHISSWSPPAALAVADWLAVTAQDVGTSSMAYRRAVAVARAYLGEPA